MSLNTASMADSKAFRTTAAEFAISGRELYAETGVDGLTHLHALYRGKVQKFDSVEVARAYLAQIGGST